MAIPSKRRRWFASSLLIALTLTAIIMGLEALGWSECWVTSYECSFEGIGDFPGGDYPPPLPAPPFYSGAMDVSGTGVKVVGHGTVDSLPPTHEESRTAVGWTSPTGTIGFWSPSDPPGLVNLGYGSAPADLKHHSHAAAISDDGAVVVGNILVGGLQKPACWIAKTVGTLPVPDGSVSGEAIDASDNGNVIVGYVCPTGLLPKGDNWSIPRRAIRWRKWAGYEATGLPDSVSNPACNSSRANAVTGSGERIVGVVYDSTQPTNSQVKYPALWWRAPLPTPTPPGPGPAFELLILRDENGNTSPGEVVDITLDGGIAVGTLGAWPHQRACYWEVLSPSLTPINAHLIPTLPGDCNSTATCVSDIGGLRVYGARSWLGAPPDSCLDADGGNIVGSFVWDANQGAQDLLDHMKMNTTIPAGWVIEQVQAVSTDGFTIVGTGDNSGIYEGWVYRCKPITTKRWCWRGMLNIERHPPTPAPPPINPLIR